MLRYVWREQLHIFDCTRLVITEVIGRRYTEPPLYVAECGGKYEVPMCGGCSNLPLTQCGTVPYEGCDTV